jgi:hypothetical protein
VKIVLRAIEQPLREIARNAGDEPSVVIAKVLEGKGNFGYNAQTGEYGDMVAMGVLDPDQGHALRAADERGASVAALIPPRPDAYGSPSCRRTRRPVARHAPGRPWAGMGVGHGHVRGCHSPRRRRSQARPLKNPASAGFFFSSPSQPQSCRRKARTSSTRSVGERHPRGVLVAGDRGVVAN